MPTSPKPSASLYEGLSAEDIDLLARRAARYARRVEGESEITSEIVLFLRGLTRYAIPLRDLREIRQLRRLARLPGASRVVPGVFQYRGEILSAHDLDAFMAAEPSSSEPSWVLVAESMGQRVGLLADEVFGVESVPRRALRSPPVTLRESGAGVEGIVNEDVLVLNLEALLALPSFARAY